ncbi:uncharacterized protein LOC120692169 [Panicum virgatum]|uniref:DUF4220 domain-containing protein n=1 Tax=Panicum virgatum TaxID=38727 RepID=A0A8T0N3Y6_PANVG|nr:uncharacterized protein LOC120692169 [Panicum virgatum]KAG2543593.1 hypothetical protein PVAP13_9NG761200 [Panicum virgatum]
MAAMAPPPLKYRPCQNPDGLVSEEALRIIVEAKACFVALAYFLTASQHRLWSSSHLVKGFLFAVTQPVTRFLVGMFTMLLAMPFRNDLYLLWGILLLAGYEGVYTISGYCVSARRSDLAIHEFARAYNIVTLGIYVRYYSRASQFRYPLWALWALMVAKFLERIVRFKIANATYGDANTSFVAEYMKHEDKVAEVTTEKSTAGSFSMEDCNYLVVGDSMSKATPERVGKEYEAKYKPADGTVTVAKVWKCGGKPLMTPNSNAPGDEDELKDVCLSFALCKLLRRKFAGVATAESERPKAQRLVFDNLIGSGWRRTFRVVRTELGFARDLLYTKYPILFSSGFPVVSTVLFAVTVGVSVWITVSAVRHYRVPHGSTSYVVHGRNVDLLITFVIVGMVTGMEICEFFIHLFSDWTKVMVISEYVQKPWLDCHFLNCILRFICSGKIAEPIGSSLGQFDLLKATKQQRCLPETIVKSFHTTRSFVLLTGDEGFRTYKCKTLRPVPDAVMDMICRTLGDNRERFTAGQEERPRRRVNLEQPCRYRAVLSDYCKAPVDIEAIMACHVATSKLEDDPGVGGSSGVANGDVRSNGGGNDLEKGRSGDGSKSSDLGYKLVATTLSKYCAYLLFYKPKLLPVTSNSVRFMCKILVDEAKAIVANGGGDKEANGKQERSGSHQEAGIVSKGQALASDLLGREPVQGDELWKALAELWCELIIMTAPHGNIGAHQKELGKGGEFITHLWALLYHAGIDDKFSGASAAAAADAAPNGEDSNGQGGGGMCTAGPGGMTTVQ